MKGSRRVVVTGLGLVSPVGSNVKNGWENILAGRSGITSLEGFELPGPDLSQFKSRIVGRVDDWDYRPYFSPKELKRLDIFLQYGIAAAQQAMEDSGFEVNDNNADWAGVSIGAGIGGITTLENTRQLLDKSGTKRVSPFCIPATIINMISGHVSIRHNLKGPNLAMSTACTTATHSIGYAARSIVYGEADMMLAGGSEKASTHIGMSGFAAAKALSTRNDEPERASRPWDKDRDGFVLGDGAGVLMLEEYESAKARGAKIYAELTGFGVSGDAYHMTSPSGEGAVKSMRHAIKDGPHNPEDIDYINAHGTSTPTGDPEESLAVETVLGDHAKNTVISSTKSMTGHLLGAAGAIEAVFSVLAIYDQVAPPTINLDNIDKDCNLDYAPNQAKQMRIKSAMTNSFGFGGTNGTLIFSQM